MKGLGTFKRYFEEYQDAYVLIGGAACDVLFSDVDAVDFRATKDLDLVLLVEALTPEFGKVFWQFIQDGEYSNKARSSGEPQFYRFDHPARDEFPFMIELFSRSEAMVLRNRRSELMPIHLNDEVSSLSAILLNQDYYEMLQIGKIYVDGIAILSETYLIPFKAKAYLDLLERKAAGLHVDGKDIKKHKNDVARLAFLLSGMERVNIPKNVAEDMLQFIQAYKEAPVDPKALGIKGYRTEEVIEVLEAVYGKGHS